jgi:transcriptional regulator with XRE-family HTH domain
MKSRKSGNPIDRHVGTRVRMRRMMLGMSQTKLGDALGVTFQQVQKYEKGTNRIGAGRLQHISSILQVPPTFFFDGAPHVVAGQTSANATSAIDEISAFMATRDGLALAKAFMRIGNLALRRLVVDLVEEIDQTKNGTAAQRRSARSLN